MERNLSDEKQLQRKRSFPTKTYRILERNLFYVGLYKTFFRKFVAMFPNVKKNNSTNNQTKLQKTSQNNTWCLHIITLSYHFKLVRELNVRRLVFWVQCLGASPAQKTNSPAENHPADN